MKKQKMILIIIAFILLFVVIGIIIDKLFFSHNSKEKIYLNYLTDRYSQEFIIKEKIENPKKINNDYIEAYNCSLKSIPNINFIVGHGKFKAEVWSIFKTDKFFDTYYENMEEYLQNKYHKKVIIGDLEIEKAEEKIKNIIEDYRTDYVKYGLSLTNKNYEYFELYLDIIYNDKVIKDVKFNNINHINSTLIKIINNNY